jgi:proline dehydrogenase
VLRGILLRAARSDRLRRAAVAMPLTRRTVDRFVAGEDVDEAVAAVARRHERGLSATVDHLGEDVTDAAVAAASARAYTALFERLAGRGFTDVRRRSSCPRSLLVVSTGESTAERGTLSVSLANGRDESRDKVRILAEAAMRYVESHQ